MKIANRAAFALLAWGLGTIASPALAQQEIPNAPDPYVHAETGVQLPGKVGPWQRTRVTEYDGLGRDISAGYGLRDTDEAVIVTLYIYPSTYGCEDEFDGMLLPIDEYGTRRSRDELSREEAFAPFGDSEQHLARYTIPPGGYGFDHMELISDAWIACPEGGEWLVKMRASYESPAAEPMIRRLIANIDWGSLADD